MIVKQKWLNQIIKKLLFLYCEPHPPSQERYVIWVRPLWKNRKTPWLHRGGKQSTAFLRFYICSNLEISPFFINKTLRAFPGPGWGLAVRRGINGLKSALMAYLSGNGLKAARAGRWVAGGGAAACDAAVGTGRNGMGRDGTHRRCWGRRSSVGAAALLPHRRRCRRRSSVAPLSSLFLPSKVASTTPFVLFWSAPHFRPKKRTAMPAVGFPGWSLQIWKS